MGKLHQVLDFLSSENIPQPYISEIFPNLQLNDFYMFFTKDFKR